MADKEKRKIIAVILSVFLAFVLWLYVMGDKNPEQPPKVIENIPVTLVNTDAISKVNLALVPNQTFTINLKIKARYLDLINVNPDSFKVEADMESGLLSKGYKNIPVKITSAPEGITILDKYPVIRVEFDSLREKNVPVKINVTGNAAKGYGYIPPVVRPTAVVVSGPERFVNNVAMVTGEIDVSGKSQDVSGSVVIKPVDIDGIAVQNVSMEPKYVDVTVPIKPAKEVPVVVRKTGTLSAGKILKDAIPDINKVTIVGEKKYLDRVDQIQTVPFDISNLNSSTSGELILNIPPGITIFNEIMSVNVTFVLENIAEGAFSIPVSIINQREGYDYTLNHNSLAVTIEGAESLLNTMDVQNLKAVIDVKDMDEGEHTVSVSLNLPNGARIKDSSALKVMVTVSKKQ